MFASLIQILPVFLIIAFGVILDLLSVLPKQTGSVIGAYVLYVALPTLMAHILAGSSVADMLHGGFWAALLITPVAMYALGYCGELFVGRRGHGPASVIGLACSCSNTAFIGLPVIISLMPGDHVALVAAGLAVVTPNVVTIPCQVQMEYLKNAGGEKSPLPRLLRAVFLNPLMMATCLGFALGASGLGLWGPVDKAATLVGNTTAPCMLLSLGLGLREKVRVALSRGQGFSYVRLVLVTLTKLVLSPMLAWFLLALFGVTGPWLVVGVIMSGTATALVSYVIAEIYGHVPEEVAMIAVVTNVLNLVTLTILAAILRWQGLL